MHGKTKIHIQSPITIIPYLFFHLIADTAMLDLCRMELGHCLILILNPRLSLNQDQKPDMVEIVKNARKHKLSATYKGKTFQSEGYSAAWVGWYVGHVLEVSTLRLDKGQGQTLWPVLARWALPVVVVVMTEMAPSEWCHFGSKADSFPGHVHGIRGGPMVVFGPWTVAGSTTVGSHGALKGIAHEGKRKRVTKGWRTEPKRGRERRGVERGMVRRRRRGRKRWVGVLSSTSSAAFAHYQRQRLCLVVGRRNAAQSATQTAEWIQWAGDDYITEAVQPLVGRVVVGGGTAVAV